MPCGRTNGKDRQIVRSSLPQDERRDDQHHGQAGADHPGDHAAVELLGAVRQQRWNLVAVAGDSYLPGHGILPVDDHSVVDGASCAPAHHDLVDGVRSQIGYDRL